MEIPTVDFIKSNKIKENNFNQSQLISNEHTTINNTTLSDNPNEENNEILEVISNEQDENSNSKSIFEILIGDLILNFSCFLDIYSQHRLIFLNKHFNSVLSSDIIWKIRCKNKFKNFTIKEIKEYGTYKKFYLESPQIKFDGVYISKTVYSRRRTLDGVLEPKNKLTNKTFIQVEYYRYLLFVPYINKVLVLRSEAPQSLAILVLKKVEQELHSNTNLGNETDDDERNGHNDRYSKLNSFVVVGDYKYDKNNNLIIINYEEPCFTSTTYINEVHLKLNHYKAHQNIYMNHRLTWKKLGISPSSNDSNNSQIEINLQSKHYEPFYFNRIISFSSRA